jgi:hypothetical protein
LFKEIFRIDPDAAKNDRFLVGSYLVMKTAIYARVESAPILGNILGFWDRQIVSEYHTSTI